MSVYVFFKPELIQLEESIRQSIYNTMLDRSYYEIQIGDCKLRISISRGELTMHIDRKNQLPPAAWDVVDHVSLRDTVSDVAMVSQMASGEYARDNGATAIVQLARINWEHTFPVADIEVIAPTWDAAIDLHREILFGCKPDQPYVKPAKPDDRASGVS